MTVTITTMATIAEEEKKENENTLKGFKVLMIVNVYLIIKTKAKD